MHEIKIGMMAGGGNSPKNIEYLKKFGFESYQVNFWQSIGETDLKELAKETMQALDGTGIVSCLGVYGNPLMEDEAGLKTRSDLYKAIDAAADFGCNMVTGFAGGLIGQSVEASIPKYKEVFGEMGRYAESKGVKIAFENCAMSGKWDSVGMNIAYCERAWELMFNELPMDNIGLEWEPCHHMVQFVDPIPQLRKWVNKFFHIHGKDATIAWDVLKQYGTSSDVKYSWHRFPGFGDCNWTDIISWLRNGGYTGSIDIEGYHDFVYRKELEYTGLVRSLNYLKDCRGGEFIPVP